jgi:hypothetical protein
VEDPRDGYVEGNGENIGEFAMLDPGDRARIPVDDTAEVYVYEFVDGTGNPVDMTGANVGITITYEKPDGTTEMVSFRTTGD